MDDKFNVLTAIALINLILTAFLVAVLPLCLTALLANPIWLILYAVYGLLIVTVANWTKGHDTEEGE